MMVESFSRKNINTSHKVKKDLHANSTSSYHQQLIVKSLKSLFISTVRFGFVFLVCQKIFHLLVQIKHWLSLSMVSEEYSSSSVKPGAVSQSPTPIRFMLNDEAVQIYRKKLETLSTDDRKAEFMNEKKQGNECFNRSHYELAVNHYTKCILSDPDSAVAYSNRAQAFLKMNKYTQALEDCNQALRIDPSLIKAKYRRGLALHHKNMFQKALQDFEDVVKNEPNNFIANHYVCKLRELLSSQPRKIMLLSNEISGQEKVIHVPEKDYHMNPKYRHCVQVNEWGLVKQFCVCNNGEPEYIRQHRRQMETQKRKQRELLPTPLPVKSANHVPNKLNGNEHEPTTSKLNRKQTDESVSILAKGLMKSLSKEKAPGPILESGEPIVQTKSMPLIRNMPLLEDETEIQVELKQSKTILQVENEHTEQNHGDCNKTDNLQSNTPTKHHTVQLANCNGINNELKLSLVQQKDEKEVENKFILDSVTKNRSELKSNDETIAISTENLKQNKMNNIFTLVKAPKHLDSSNKQDALVENKPSNKMFTLTRSEPLISTKMTSLSLDNKGNEKPSAVIQTNLSENKPPIRALTKSQKRQIRRRNFKRQGQDTREEKDNEYLCNTETNHKVSTKSKTYFSSKPQATSSSNNTTGGGEKKRLKRKISTNNNKAKCNESDMGQGDNAIINKHADEAFRNYEDKVHSKFILLKSKESVIGNSQKNAYSGEAIVGGQCLEKKVNKWLKSNQFPNTGSNEDNNMKTKDRLTATLMPGKRNITINGHDNDDGDFYH